MKTYNKLSARRLMTTIFRYNEGIRNHLKERHLQMFEKIILNYKKTFKQFKIKKINEIYKLSSN